jgi:hypothetical protein
MGVCGAQFFFFLSCVKITKKQKKYHKAFLLTISKIFVMAKS